MKTFLRNSLLMAALAASIPGSQAQGLVAGASGEGLKVRQKPGTESRLRDYLSGFAEEDTIHAIIFPPGNCPRCEAVINPITKGLKELRPGIPTVLISAYPDSVAARKYIDRYSMTADFRIYDTAGVYGEIFSFDAGYLHIPYLLKIAPSAGELIVGVRAEDNSEDFLSEFCRYATPLEKKEFELSKEHSGLFKAPDSHMNVRRRYTLSHPDTITLSETVCMPEFYKNRLFFNDKLGECILYFEVCEGDPPTIVFRREIRTDRRQNRSFVQIPDSLYRIFEDGGDVRFIPLSPKMIDERTLAVSYSLPKLWFTGTNAVGYMNQACVLLVNPESAAAGEVLPLTKDSGDGFFYPHFSLFKYGGDLATGCERVTWPMELEKEEYFGKPECDPFSEEFYTYPQPTAATFDIKTGQLKERVGNLPGLSRQTRTGYYFAAPVMDSWGREIVMSDGFSGEIELFGEESPGTGKILRAFDIPPGLIPEPEDSTFYSYDCVAPYIGIFNRNIVDLKLTGDKIYCLVRYGLHGKDDPEGDSYSVIEIDRECGCATEKAFKLDNTGLKYCGLRRTEDGIEPYAICKDGNNWEVVTFSF